MQLPFEHRTSMYIRRSEKPIKELMRMQSKGQFLTSDEKNRVLLHAEEKRKQRLNK